MSSAPPPPAAPTPTEPACLLLDGLLYGRRQSPRNAVRVEVSVRAADGRRVRGRTLDASRGGMLVEFPIATLARDARDAVAAALAADALLDGGLAVTFPGHPIRSTARVVRAVLTPFDSGVVRVGMRFDTPLRKAAAKQLGIVIGPPEKRVRR